MPSSTQKHHHFQRHFCIACSQLCAAMWTVRHKSRSRCHRRHKSIIIFIVIFALRAHNCVRQCELCATKAEVDAIVATKASSFSASGLVLSFYNIFAAEFFESWILFNPSWVTHVVLLVHLWLGVNIASCKLGIFDATQHEPSDVEGVIATGANLLTDCKVIAALTPQVTEPDF